MKTESLSTNFPRYVAHQLLELKRNPNDYLRYHQMLVREYTRNPPPGVKGVLLDQIMGSGKTIASISIAESVRLSEPSRRIIVLSPKSLAENYRKQLISYIRNVSRVSYPEAQQIVEKNYRFVSQNASNMYERILDKKLAEMLSQEPSLEHTLIIMDEAQNFFNAIINGSKNAIALYDRLLNTKDYLFFPMSGTPVTKDVFALSPCFNLLSGYAYLPETRDKFYSFFVNEQKMVPRNASYFMNFITGKVSYYGDLIFPEGTNKGREDFPEELPDIVEEVHMSAYQYGRYHAVRTDERKQTERKYRKAEVTGRFESGSISGSYRVRSRQTSNFVFPAPLINEIERATVSLPHERRAEVESAMREGLPAKLTAEDLTYEKLELYSPKLLRLMHNLKKHDGQKGVIYSSFVTGPGLAVISRALDAHGYKGKYGFVTGSVSAEEREKSRLNFNSGKISLLLISSAGSEGLNLVGVRHLHIFEPYWHYARIAQVKARAVRFRSHANLPPDERNVQSYIYLSIFPKKHKQSQEEETTDSHLWKESIRNRKLIREFQFLLAKASVDCAANVKHLGSSFECRDCMPTDIPLYSDDLSFDLTRPSPCISSKDHREELDAKEIEYKGRTLWYVLDDKTKKIEVYEYDPVLKEYLQLSFKDPDLPGLVSEILKT